MKSAQVLAGRAHETWQQSPTALFQPDLIAAITAAWCAGGWCSRTMTGVTLIFPERAAPLAVLAAAKLAGVQLEVKPDGKLSKDAAPTLVFASG